jgi:hypothetical protein
MTLTVPTSWPPYLTAGTDWQWTVSLRVKETGDTVDPADSGWSLIKAYFLGKSSAIVPATAQTTDWLFTLANASTTSVQAGNYRWQITGTYASKIYELEPVPTPADNTIEILATPIVSAASDNRTHNERMLALIEAELVARVTGVGSSHESYSNGDIAIQKIPLEQLEALRNKYALAAQLERHDGTLPPYAVVFRRPGMIC